MKNFSFKSKVWLWPGEFANWHFTSIPKEESVKLREKYKGLQRGWNSLKVQAKIGRTVWETSIFFDAKSGQYMLPLKATVRKAEGIFQGDGIQVKLKII
ncbi:hypothetical protein A2392_03080 [Candidatus Kaiserbacteria bacterium RIFOXYB1_FULL_46_14]|uniref:DUF1905 domain-containing protein n=1 Tax=Candidatus Kaiserbacteria bacterium RIFOXYB1_FULL_46_14 TaxID=1798531 RepID=A0A1F6FIR2_9BACT|nr:MAG: hypothetical protein A2392_03080 [Candidatus Kaiserbacteria bacterium RIFOXYB1_FULL_46_14]